MTDQGQAPVLERWVECGTATEGDATMPTVFVPFILGSIAWAPNRLLTLEHYQDGRHPASLMEFLADDGTWAISWGTTFNPMYHHMMGPQMGMAVLHHHNGAAGTGTLVEPDGANNLTNLTVFRHDALAFSMHTVGGVFEYCFGELLPNDYIRLYDGMLDAGCLD